jgi:VCBS repeat-containing protein
MAKPNKPLKNGNDAAADFASATEDVAQNIDVLANDKKNTSLYSVDQDDPSVVQTVARSELGATIKILNGQIYYDPSGSLAIESLAAGKTATDSFQYATIDKNGKISWATVTITVTGANDIATIAGPATGSVTEDGPLTAGGTLAVSDVDTGENHFQTPGSLAGVYGTFSFNATTGVWGYTLNNAAANVQALRASDAVHDTLTVKSFDGTATHNIDVVINGVNDAAVIGDPSVPAVTEAAAVDGSGNLTAIGTVPISDVDKNEASFQTTVTGAANNLGNLVLAADGSYTYTVANSAVQYLGANESKVDTFTITSVDGTQKQVSFTVNGANDAPVITTTSPSPVNYGAVLSGLTRFSGTIGFSDADRSDTHVVGFYPGHVLGGTLNVWMRQDSTGGGAGLIDWTLDVSNAALAALVTPNIVLPITTDFIVTIADQNGGFTSQQVTHTETLIVGDSSANPLVGTPGDDIIVGLGAANLLSGRIGDVFVSNGGNDVLIGSGSSFDAADFSALTSAISVNMAAGSVTSGSIFDSAVLINIDGIVGTNSNDLFNATGFVGPNGFEGLGGNDQIIGNGYTTLSYKNASEGVSINVAAGAANGGPSVGQDTFSSVNDFLGSNSNDVYNASGYLGPNSFEGLGRNDMVYGNGLTTLSYTHATAGVAINLAAGTVIGDASVGTDTFSGVSIFQDSYWNDTYDARGFSGKNEFFVTGGSDTIYGNGLTEVSYQNATGGVLIDLPRGQVSGGPGSGTVGIATDTLNSVARIDGSNFSDVIRINNTTKVYLTLDPHGSPDGISPTVTASEDSGSISIATAFGIAPDTFIFVDGGHFSFTSETQVRLTSTGPNYIGSFETVNGGQSLTLTGSVAGETFSIGTIDGPGWEFSVTSNQIQSLSNAQTQQYGMTLEGSHGYKVAGGAGADKFVFNSLAMNNLSTITDFTPGEDLLQIGDHTSELSYFGLPHGSSPLVVNTTNLAAAVSALAHDQVAFIDLTNGQDSTLYWAINGQASAIVNLQHITSLSSSDFFVF